MADVNYECLPQRAPRPKRKRALQNPLDASDVPTTKKDSEKAILQVAAAAVDVSAAAVDSQADDTAAKADNKPTVEGIDDSDGASEPLEYRAAAEAGQKFEYLDHTADVQLHAWGADLKEAFENVGLAMFNYMTPLSGLLSSEEDSEGAEGPKVVKASYAAEAHDLPSLLYHWLDELLFGFSVDFFVPKMLKITRFDRDEWKIEAEAEGAVFDRQRHVSGTEIKAITYSAMQINEKEGDAEVFVIVDI